MFTFSHYLRFSSLYEAAWSAVGELHGHIPMIHFIAIRCDYKYECDPFHQPIESIDIWFMQMNLNGHISDAFPLFALAQVSTVILII